MGDEATVTDAQYLRIQARYRGRLGVEVGVFVAVDHLRRANMLTEAEEAQYFDIDDWFNEHLPNPPFYEDGNSIGAVTWFKLPVPTEMAERITILRSILDAHGVEHDVVIAEEPGEQVYEDDFQVGVVPRQRHTVTAMPEGLVLGPTSAGSKRQFAQNV